MITYYLRYDTESAMNAAIISADWIQEGAITPEPDYRFDVVGAVETVAAVYDANGDEITPAVVDQRPHANVYALADGALPAAFASAEIVAPASPRRRFGLDP